MIGSIVLLAVAQLRPAARKSGIHAARRRACGHIRPGVQTALVAAALTAVSFTAATGFAQHRAGYDPAAWIGDLQQFRAAIDRRYPNLEWLISERQVSLDRWFDHTAAAIRNGGSDADARRALDALAKRFNDGHVDLRWPMPSRPDSSKGNATETSRVATVGAFCAVRGYDGSQVTRGTAASLPRHRSIDDKNAFRPGLVAVGDTLTGTIRIGSFSPQAYPTLCEEATATLRIAAGAPCAATCEDRLLTTAFALMTRHLIDAVEQLRSAGAQVLLIDLSRNGGGTEWAEAAARIVSPVPLRSAPIRVVRDAAWVARWAGLTERLRKQAKLSPRSDRSKLLDYAERAHALAEGSKPCPTATCSRLAPAGFASGLVAELPAGQLHGKTWAPEVFSAAQFPYRDSVWKGPVIVLVDDETWSAAEQFAALLQDNAAAIVMGTRTGGAGCGHLYNDAPAVLPYSKAELSMPNCARFRRDGSNEVGGIVPDVSTGVRWNDGPAYAGRLTAGRLPDAIRRAEVLTGGSDRRTGAVATLGKE